MSADQDRPARRPTALCLLASLGLTLVVFGIGAFYLFVLLVALNEVKGAIGPVIILAYVGLVAAANLVILTFANGIILNVRGTPGRQWGFVVLSSTLCTLAPFVVLFLVWLGAWITAQ